MKDRSSYEHIFFDLDGTLTDPWQGITRSVSKGLEACGIAPPPQRELLAFIGPPLSDSFYKYFGLEGEENDKAIRGYRAYFSVHGLFENELYEGIPEMLKKLTDCGKKVYIATSKPEVYAKRIAEHFDIAKYFTDIAGATLDGSIIKKADVISLLFERHKLSQSDSILMVGDREHDIIGAKLNSLPSCGVLYGYGSRDELENSGADYIVGTVAELNELLSR